MSRYLPQREKTNSKLYFFSNVESRLTYRSKLEVTQKLEGQYQHLIYKRQKQKQRKEKILRMTQDYEKKRSLEKEKLRERFSHSLEIKTQTLQNVMDKIKDRQKKYNESRRRITNNSLYNIEKSLVSQKKLENSSISYYKKKYQNLTAPKNKHSNNLSKVMSIEKAGAQQKAKKLAFKLEKAEQNMRYKKYLEEKKRNDSEKEFSLYKIKIKEKKNHDEEELVKRLYKKASTLDYYRMNAEERKREKTEERRKNTEKKQKKWCQNMERLQYENEEKLQKLHNKLMQTQKSSKSWKSEKNQRYLELFQKNSLDLQMKKEEKADTIMNKHLNMSQKSRFYKQRKNQMLQTLRTVDLVN